MDQPERPALSANAGHVEAAGGADSGGIRARLGASLPPVLQKIVELACVVADARYRALSVLGKRAARTSSPTASPTGSAGRSATCRSGGQPRGPVTAAYRFAPAHPGRPAAWASRPTIPHDLVPWGPGQRPRAVLSKSLPHPEAREPEFTHEDERAVMTLAALAGVAFENPRLFARRSRAGDGGAASSGPSSTTRSPKRLFR